MKQITRVVLDITWDDTESEHPANWNWHDLLVSEPGESVELISADASE
jgi:hypothetical protein